MLRSIEQAKSAEGQERRISLQEMGRLKQEKIAREVAAKALAEQELLTTHYLLVTTYCLLTTYCLPTSLHGAGATRGAGQGTG